jgi:predicted PurR-regulated permease PerM
MITYDFESFNSNTTGGFVDYFLSFFLLDIVFSVLLFMASDYPFDIFKHFLTFKYLISPTISLTTSIHIFNVFVYIYTCIQQNLCNLILFKKEENYGFFHKQFE